MSPQLTIVPDPRLADLAPILDDRLRQVLAGIKPHNFASLLDSLMKDLIREGFDHVRAHEGTLWLIDAEGEHLVPVYNTGPDADKFVGKFRQPLHSGLVSMVFANEQSFAENDIQTNPQQSKLLDDLLQLQTTALMVVPLYYLRACRGVISCVQLQGRIVKRQGSDPAPSGFRPADLASLERNSALLTRLLEFRLLSAALSWNATGAAG